MLSRLVIREYWASRLNRLMSKHTSHFPHNRGLAVQSATAPTTAERLQASTVDDCLEAFVICVGRVNHVDHDGCVFGASLGHAMSVATEH